MDPGDGTRLHYSQKVLQAPDIAALRQQQRNGRQNLWDTKYFFPNAPEGSRDLRSDICDRDSCLAASTFYCGGMHGCNRGDCARQVESLDIYLWRVRVLGEITLDRPDEAASPANFSSRFVPLSERSIVGVDVEGFARSRGAPNSRGGLRTS